MTSRLVGCVLAGLWLTTIPCELSAAIIYVNNQMGNDRYDGLAEVVVNAASGPVQTLRRAVQLARAGDTISLANTGVPYYEPLMLNGARHSGLPRSPFTILGNGAEINGARAVPPTAWQPVGDRLWKLSPYRKGHYQLFLAGQPVTEFHPNTVTAGPSALPPGQWMVWEGTILYRTEDVISPVDQPFAFATETVGVTLYEVENVRIVDLTVRHFQLDGINAHDRCRDVILENVVCCENGRAGVTSAGTSQITVRNSALVNNRLHSLLITEHAVAEVQNSMLTEPPHVEE